MVVDEYGIEPDPWQVEALRAFPTSPRLALCACKGPGKTAVEAWVIWNFMATRPFPKGAATSITRPNLRDNLWAELALWRSRSKFLREAFEWTNERIFARSHPETWVFSARAWNRDANPEQQAMTLAGIHADYALLVMDESGGIPDSVAAAADAVLASGIEAHVVQAGNPTHLSGPLYRACTSERPLWRVFEITGDPDDPKRAPRVRKEWARDQITKYGRDSALVQVNVFGKFPKGATDALISMQAFEDAFARWPGTGLAREPKTMGVDVARFGTAETVVYFREGDLLTRREGWHGQDTTYSAGRIAEYFEEFEGCVAVNVDDIGVGGGLTDQLRAAGVPVVGVNVGTSPSDPTKHVNLRSELNLAMQDRFREGLIAIAPEIREQTTLMAEGCTLRVGFSTASRRKIEAKDAYVRRTGSSPDDWDAVVLAFVPTEGASYVSEPDWEESDLIVDRRY